MRGKVKKVCFLKLMDEELLMKHDSSSLTSLRGLGTLRTPSFNHAEAIKIVYRVKHGSLKGTDPLSQNWRREPHRRKRFLSPFHF
jgi:hypothetical protein